MEGIRAAHRSRAAFGDDIGDPVRRVRGHVSDLRTALGAEQVEEPAQGGLVPARRGPDQPPTVMIDNDGQVAVALPVADLTDADPAQPREPVDPGHGVGGNPGDDRPDGAPGDAHQLHHRALRTRHRHHAT